MTFAAVQLAPVLGQVELHNRTGENAPCQAQQGKVFCLDWAIDNFDRYTTPLLNQLLLVLIAVAIGFAVAFALCLGVNQLPMPGRFQGMVVTWTTGLGAVALLVLIGVVTSTLPARRAAMLPPVEALRFES
jgi:ABC-type lipoprotein release transport system permease subunit